MLRTIFTTSAVVVVVALASAGTALAGGAPPVACFYPMTVCSSMEAHGSPAVVDSTTSDPGFDPGFDWASAGMGAGVGVAMLLAALGSGTLVTRRRRTVLQG
jgi:hypothetical protein